MFVKNVEIFIVIIKEVVVMKLLEVIDEFEKVYEVIDDKVIMKL